MNKKAFLKTYQNIDKLNKTEKAESDTKPPLYRSSYDEKLIKEMHFAKFKKNLQQTQQNESLKQLLEKENWDEEDTKTLLKSLR
ncbi:hypothetical protein [Marinomonas pollencensis]|uniref:Uncharacterized protein n=1 Tax=Marinomonas pollencensis TaxID=491954 RepID=A0A3E0DPM4_9GAMM|nr:hypothetical protein [Marinomonas pollencensis]REG84202.1 hypothetical protein DFP81_10481 [Marinomonas pollencensis]